MLKPPRSIPSRPQSAAKQRRGESARSRTRRYYVSRALQHRPNLNYLQFYGRRNVIIMRAKDHIAAGSRGWCRSYLPPDLHPPAGHPFSFSLTHTPSSMRFRPSLRSPYILLSPFSLSLSSTTLLRTGGALAMSISSEASLSSTDHLTHK